MFFQFSLVFARSLLSIYASVCMIKMDLHLCIPKKLLTLNLKWLHNAEKHQKNRSSHKELKLRSTGKLFKCIFLL
jgi:hypothetical protein